MQGYTDGHKVMLSLSLTGPQGDLERYSSVLFAGYGQTSTATINGETAQIQGVNSFEEREGSWDTTMAVVVPESQQEAETLEVAVTLQGLEGKMAELGAHGEVKTISTEPIQGSFSASFTLRRTTGRRCSLCRAPPPKRWSLWKSPSGAIGTLAPWRRTA